MESKILVHEKAFIPWVKEPPFEETEAWDRAMNDSGPETQKAIIQSVPDDETFQRKIAKPLLDHLDKMLKPDCINRRGLSKEAIMAIARAKLTGPNAAKNYGEKVKKGYKRKILDQGERNLAMVEYHLGRSFGPHRCKDAIEKVLGLLTPFIQPDKQGRFKSKFSNQVERSGKLITELAYHPDIRKQENDKLYSLINKDLRKGIIPFSTGGAAVPPKRDKLRPACPDECRETEHRDGDLPAPQQAGSHCDFVPIPDSIVLFDSTKVKDIKYGIYKHFMGEKHANILRSLWRVIDESIPPNPDEYIGHPEKPAYFDMNLDIQIATKE